MSEDDTLPSALITNTQRNPLAMKVLITGPFDDSVLSDLGSQGFEIVRRPQNLSPQDLTDALADVDGFLMGGPETLTIEAVEAARKLRIVVFMGEQAETFVDERAKDLLDERGIPLRNTPGVSTNAVAEMTCGLILCALRRIPYLTASTREHRWLSITGEELAGKSLGIFGMGKIGYTVAKRLSGFDLGRLVYSDMAASDRAENDLNAERAELDDLVRESDVLSIHAPLTPETSGIIGEELLRRMKPSAVLVNTARADIVKPSALRRALEERWISCAAFDGYYVEGTDFEENNDPHGLLEMHERFFLTSHQAYNTHDAVCKSSLAAVELIIEFFS